jgi:hypothetical protein
VGSLDLSPEPEGAGRPELADVGGRRRSYRELPDPEERSRSYDAYVDADRAEREIGYQDEVPRFSPDVGGSRGAVAGPADRRDSGPVGGSA